MAFSSVLAALGVVVLNLAMLLVVPLDPELSYEFPRNRTATPQEKDSLFSTDSYTRFTFYIDSHGDKLHIWLYLPAQSKAGSEPPPVVILAQGLGAQKDLGIHKYAHRFASAGIAAAAFDYRTFGGSDGEPRNWASPRRHLEDWWTVVQYIQDNAFDGLVNSKKLALWGSSYSGGHVLVTAAKLGRNVSAVISQVPHLVGAEAIRSKLRTQGLWRPVRTLLAGVHDVSRTAVGLSPAYIKTVGLPGELCLMPMTEEGLKVYYSRHPEVYMGGWLPRVRARLVLEHSHYSPMKSVPNITAPVLFIGAAYDTICPPSIIVRAHKLLNNSVYYEEKSSHFGIYSGQGLENIMNAMVEFLSSKLLPPTQAEVAAEAPSIES